VTKNPKEPFYTALRSYRSIVHDYWSDMRLLYRELAVAKRASSGSAAHDLSLLPPSGDKKPLQQKMGSRAGLAILASGFARFLLQRAIATHHHSRLARLRALWFARTSLY